MKGDLRNVNQVPEITMAERTFEQWVDCIFDHPVRQPEWYWADGADLGVEDSDEVNVQYIIRLFNHCDVVLRRFDDAQTNQGLNLIASISCSDHAFSITHGNAPWIARRACIRSIFDLYEKCFARRCTATLSHLDEPGSPLNYICYMWWDLLPFWLDSNSSETEIEEAKEYVAVMKRCLTLSHDACLEGTLHGLGLFQLILPDQVEPIIDQFLCERSHLQPELVAYARRAR